ALPIFTLGPAPALLGRRTGTAGDRWRDVERPALAARRGRRQWRLPRRERRHLQRRGLRRASAGHRRRRTPGAGRQPAAPSARRLPARPGRARPCRRRAAAHLLRHRRLPALAVRWLARCIRRAARRLGASASLPDRPVVARGDGAWRGEWPAPPRKLDRRRHAGAVGGPGHGTSPTGLTAATDAAPPAYGPAMGPAARDDIAEDRKSTRLNSSHVKISYA